MTLYNLKTDGDQYRITKFTNDLEVESSYLVTEQECECPAGSRPTCRHRQMLPTMLAEGLEDSGGFYDFDRRQVLMPVEDQIAVEDEGPVDLVEIKPETELPVGVQANTTNEAHPTIGHIKRRI